MKTCCLFFLFFSSSVFAKDTRSFLSLRLEEGTSSQQIESLKSETRSYKMFFKKYYSDSREMQFVWAQPVDADIAVKVCMVLKQKSYVDSCKVKEQEPK